MTGCAPSSTAELLRGLEATADAVMPEVRRLLAGLSPDEPLTETGEDGTRVLEVAVRFPDAIGRGTLSARLFRYRNGVRIDIAVTHNRVIALADGQPTARACFLNDYVASVTLGPDVTVLPDRFRAEVESGVPAALEAVETHNRRFPQPWSRIRVAIAP